VTFVVFYSVCSLSIDFVVYSAISLHSCIPYFLKAYWCTPGLGLGFTHQMSCEKGVGLVAMFGEGRVRVYTVGEGRVRARGLVVMFGQG
jgi:hypothetical protein